MTKKEKKIDPNRLSQQGLNFFNEGNFIDAKKNFDELNKYFPNNPDLLNLIGFSALQLELYEDALKAYSDSIGINPNQPGVFFNTAIIKNKIGDKEDALTFYDKALKLDPKNLDIYQNKSAIFEDLGYFDLALDQINIVLQSMPNNDHALANRGNIYQNKFEYDLAKKDYLAALEINPSNTEILINLGNVLKHLGEYKESELTFLDALDKVTENNSVHFNLSILLLFLKKFDRGWKEYEYRETNIKKPEFLKNLKEADQIHTEDKLLIWSEQGIGDQIIFSSMLNNIPQPNSVTVSIDKRLIPIYERSFQFLKFVSFDNLSEKFVRNFDYHLPIGGLGKFYRSHAASFKEQKYPFLKTNDLEVKKIKKKLGIKSGKVCGISWKSKNEKIGFAKSFKLEDMIDLLSLQNINFIDLQYGNNDKEKNDLKVKSKINIEVLDGLDKFNDIDGLLNLIEVCDFVVTTSNVTAHLAGAIGKKTYLIVPHGVGSLWYWHDEPKSIWYPSIEIYRQNIPNEWKNIVKKITKEIKANFL